MFKLAAIDLDDTLLSRDKTISPANRAALNRLRSAGIEVVLASGRRHENMLRYHRELGLDGLIVSSQGAMVRHGEQPVVLRQVLLDPDLVRRVLAEAAARQLTSIYYHLEGVFAHRRDRWVEVYEELAQAEVSLCRDPRELEEGTLKLISTGGPDDIRAHFPGMAATLHGPVEILVSNPHQIECMTQGVNKATGLQALGVAPEHVVAFGDNENDVAMLRWARLGVAMPHSTAAAREAADRLAPAGDPDTCLARAVEELFDA